MKSKIITGFPGRGHPKIAPQCDFFSVLQSAQNNAKMLNIFGVFEGRMKTGFTLAEVLITLGIIGVIAAITIPGVMDRYRTKALETGMARFYSVVNQGFALSATQNGDEKDWEDFGDDSCAFYKRYLADYIKADYECGYYNQGNGKPSKLNDDRFVGIYFPSGDMAVFSYGKYWTYTRKTGNQYRAYGAIMSNPEAQKDLFGTELFVFQLGRTLYNPVPAKRPTGIVPFDMQKYSSVELLERCKKYPLRCAGVIVQNGWKVPKNYPYKIR